VATSLGGGLFSLYNGPANSNIEFRFQTVVPIPPAAWLFGSALGVMGVLRRKATA
jgi:hypothetical protein